MRVLKLVVLALLMAGIVSCPDCRKRIPGGPGVQGQRDLVVMGDSIHALSVFPEIGPDITAKLLELRPSTRSPLNYVNKSQLGATSAHGASNVVTWLVAHSDARYFALAYGRNDHDTIGAPAFEANMRFMIKVLLADKKTPILPSIAWSPGSATGTAPLDAIIHKLSGEFGVPLGPDLRRWFETHPEELGEDFHPNAAGKLSINRLWAEMLHAYLPKH